MFVLGFAIAQARGFVWWTRLIWNSLAPDLDCERTAVAREEQVRL